MSLPMTPTVNFKTKTKTKTKFQNKPDQTKVDFHLADLILELSF